MRIHFYNALKLWKEGLIKNKLFCFYNYEIYKGKRVYKTFKFSFETSKAKKFLNS